MTGLESLQKNVKNIEIDYDINNFDINKNRLNGDIRIITNDDFEISTDIGSFLKIYGALSFYNYETDEAIKKTLDILKNETISKTI